MSCLLDHDAGNFSEATRRTRRPRSVVTLVDGTCVGIGLSLVHLGQICHSATRTNYQGCGT